MCGNLYSSDWSAFAVAGATIKNMDKPPFEHMPEHHRKMAVQSLGGLRDII